MTPEPIDDDVAVLHGMGYAQELSRRMRGFSNFATSICLPPAASSGPFPGQQG